MTKLTRQECGHRAGLARAKALSPEERRAIAKKGAVARWGEKPPKAIRKGNFKDEFGIDVDCYVLDDEHKTAVISQRGMGTALGIGEMGGGGLVLRFLGGAKVAPFVGAELAVRLQNPLLFQGSPAASNGAPSATVHGYDVTVLIDVCNTIIKADNAGVLLQRQDHIVQQARTIVGASAKAGIKGLVYALTGYDATKAEVISAFKLFVQEEARGYEKEFPDELYNEWYRIYKLPKPGRNKPWKFMHLTVNHVYYPLARSSGKILTLMRAQKAESSERHTKLHQFLAEIGSKALRVHLGVLLGLALLSKTKEEYEKNVAKVFPKQAIEMEPVE